MYTYYILFGCLVGCLLLQFVRDQCCLRLSHTHTHTPCLLCCVVCRLPLVMFDGPGMI